MKRMTVTWCILVAAVCAAGTARAEGQDRGRAWGLGWDNGLTVRRLVGPWELGVSAGPNDARGDDYTYTSSPDLPDSVSGGLTDSTVDRRESGFVRLYAAHPLAAYRTLQLSAVGGAGYSWSDMSTTDRHYYAWDNGWRTERRDIFTDTWQVTAGFRVAWFPVPFLSLETEFGLSLRWVDRTTKVYDLNADDLVPTQSHATSSDNYFEDYGPYSLTSDIQLVVWF